MSLRRSATALLLACVAGVAPLAQGPPPLPRVQIQSPDTTAFVSGPTELKASVEPATGVTSVAFS